MQLREHRSALTSLVHDLHDPTSAEIYCTLCGEIVPPKTAQSLGDRFELQAWGGTHSSSNNAWKTWHTEGPVDQPNSDGRWRVEKELDPDPA